MTKMPDLVALGIWEDYDENQHLISEIEEGQEATRPRSQRRQHRELPRRAALRHRHRDTLRRHARRAE
jgi:hypothetical protein